MDRPEESDLSDSLFTFTWISSHSQTRKIRTLFTKSEIPINGQQTEICKTIMGISVFKISSEREILEKDGLLHDANSKALSVELTNGSLDSFIMFGGNAQFREIECRNGLSVVQLLLIHSRDNHTHG